MNSSFNPAADAIIVGMTNYKDLMTRVSGFIRWQQLAYGTLYAIAVWLICHFMGLNLALCALLAIPTVAIVSLVVGFVTASIIWFRRVYLYRAECPHCGAKDLRAGRMCLANGQSDPQLRYHVATCRMCSYQVHRHEGGSVEVVAPADPRYLNEI